jgi:hypothetical protein
MAGNNIPDVPEKNEENYIKVTKMEKAIAITLVKFSSLRCKKLSNI